MCGRFALFLDAEEMRVDLGLDDVPTPLPLRFNIAPSQQILVVTASKINQAVWMRWGLIPFWAKDSSIGSRLINARSETISVKPAFKQSFAQRRCLIPANGFYEWLRVAGKKTQSIPYYFQKLDRTGFFMAGIWDIWQSDNREIRSCSIITCDANESVREIHDRMPVMLDREDGARWLKGRSPTELLALLRPYPGELMETFPVSDQVNKPGLDIPECVLPLVS